eukprot:GFYU01007492.1.p1 GENE.GFYU01007492.1~~GFYU01007492.1.p1  ORF type:complete len:582 (-),score=189.42 GFYU01007492.1:399-2144(-)
MVNDTGSEISYKGPPLSKDRLFAVSVTEGKTKFKRGDIEAAVDAFSRALQCRPKDKLVLLERSLCYLRLGDPDKSIKDADKTLEDDKKYWRGLYRKAEALYYSGNFEFALVQYHRGHHIRPDVARFRLGIQKAKEAIELSFSSTKYAQDHLKMVQMEMINAMQEDAGEETATPGAGSVPRLDLTTTTQSMNNSTALSGRGLISPAGKACKTPSRTLLGELYDDKKYLEDLKNDKTLKWMDDSQKVLEEVNNGLEYINVRSQFWRQRNPFTVVKPSSIGATTPMISPRKYSDELGDDIGGEDGRSTAGPGTPAAGGGGAGGDGKYGSPRNKQKTQSRKKYLEHTRFTVQAMENVHNALANGDPELALRFAKSLLKRIVTLEIADKPRVLGKLYSDIGNIYIELDKLSLASVHHQKDLDLALKYNYQDGFLRALGNLGNTYRLLGDYPQAISIWEKKMEFVDDTEVLDLCEDLARCCVDGGEYEKATRYGEVLLEKSLPEDKKRHLAAYSILGHVNLKTAVYDKALMNFDKCLNISREMQDEAMEAEALTNLGNTYLALGDAQKSIQLQEQALALSTKSYIRE